MKWIDPNRLAAKLSANLHQDERTTRNTQQASLWAVLAAYVYLVVEILYKVISTKSFDDCGWAVGLILLISIVLLFAEKNHAESMLPRSLNRKLLPTGKSGADKKRRIVHYILNALFFSVSMAVLSVIFHFGFGVQDSQFEGISALQGAAQIFGTFFVFSLLVNWLGGEHSIKKYKKQCEALEEDAD